MILTKEKLKNTPLLVKQILQTKGLRRDSTSTPLPPTSPLEYSSDLRESHKRVWQKVGWMSTPVHPRGDAPDCLIMEVLDWLAKL